MSRYNSRSKASASSAGGRGGNSPGLGLSGPSKALDEQDNAINALKQQLEQERERLRDLSSSYSFSNLSSHTNRGTSQLDSSKRGERSVQSHHGTERQSPQRDSQATGRSPFKDSLVQSQSRTASFAQPTQRSGRNNKDHYGGAETKTEPQDRYDDADTPLTASALDNRRTGPSSPSEESSSRKAVSFGASPNYGRNQRSGSLPKASEREGDDLGQLQQSSQQRRSPTSFHGNDTENQGSAAPRSSIVRSTVDSLRAENQQLSNLVEQTQGALDDERKRREELFHKYKQELETKEECQSEITRLKRKLEEREGENQRLRNDKANTESQLYATSEKLANMESEKNELESKLKESHESLESANTEKHRYSEKAHRLEEQYNSLNEELKKARSEYQELYSKFTVTENNKSTLVAQQERDDSERLRFMRSIALALQDVFKSLDNGEDQQTAEGNEVDDKALNASLFFQSDWSSLLSPEKLSELFDVVQHLQRKTVQLVSNSESNRKRSEKRAQELENSWKRIEQLSSHLYSLQDANQEIREELKQAQEKWTTQRQRLIQEADSRSDQHLKQKQREIDSIKEELGQAKEDLRQTELKNEELYTSLERKDEQIKELQHQVDSQSSAYDTVEKERQQYRDQYAREQEDRQAARAEIEELKKSQENLERERDQAKKKVDTLNRNNEELQGRVDNLERELRLKANKLQEVEAAKSQTEVEYAQWKRRVESLEAQIKEQERGSQSEKASVLSMKDKIKRLEDELESQKPMMRELRHKREECSNLSNEIESLKNENDRLERKLKVAQSEYEEISAQFNSEKEQMAHKEQLWDQKVRELQAEEERQKGRLQHQISMIKHEQQGNLEKIRSLHSEKEMSNRQLEDAREELSASKQTIEALKRELNGAHSVAARLGSSSHRLQLRDSNINSDHSAVRYTTVYDSPVKHHRTTTSNYGPSTTPNNGTSNHYSRSRQHWQQNAAGKTRDDSRVAPVSPTSAHGTRTGDEGFAEEADDDEHDGERDVVQVDDDVFVHSPSQQPGSFSSHTSNSHNYHQYEQQPQPSDGSFTLQKGDYTSADHQGSVSLHDLAAHGLGGLASPYEPAA